MKRTRGFVAMTHDNQYLHMSSHQGAKNVHVAVAVMPDIEDATIRNYPQAKDRREADALLQHNVRWVAVEVRREVVLESTLREG